MSRKKQRRATSEQGGHGGKRRSCYCHTSVTEHEFATLKSVLSGYLGFLRNLASVEPEQQAALARVQAVHDRLPEHAEASDTIYFFSYEERLTMLEAIITVQVLLMTPFPPTELKARALADVERLYQRLMSAQSLPLN